MTRHFDLDVGAVFVEVAHARNFRRDRRVGGAGAGGTGNKKLAVNIAVGMVNVLLPRFAVVDTARDNDAARAVEVCAGIGAGQIVIFDRAYVDFAHLFGLLIRGLVWDRFDAPGLLQVYGTAGGPWRMSAQPE